VAERRARKYLWVACDFFRFGLRVVVREVSCAIDRQGDCYTLARGADGFEVGLTRALLVVDGGPTCHA
jgi:hypothetical protein